jgi:dipeptidyl aminopeptidase/acylaminoacyl peptidase
MLSMTMTSTRPRLAAIVAALVTLCGAAILAQTPPVQKPLLQKPTVQKPPLSIEAALKVSQYAGYSISPDGVWLTYANFDPTTDRRRLRLMEIATGREIGLGSPSGNTSQSVWSPDSRWLAFHSDAAGTPQLWIWDRAREQERAIPGAELATVDSIPPAWLPDSRRLVAELWPEGEARPPIKNTPDAKSPFRPPFKPVGPDQLSVYVHRANLDPEVPAARTDTSQIVGCDLPLFGKCDVGIVDVETGDVTRVVRKSVLTWFLRPSPDGRFLGYAVKTGVGIATQLQFFDLHVIELATGRDRVIAKDVRTHGGLTCVWSPDSTRIAHVSLRTTWDGAGDRNKVTPGDLAVIPIDGTGQRVFDTGLPVLYGRVKPLWSVDGQRLYAMSVDQQLVEIDLRTGTGRMVTALSGQQELMRVVTPRDSPVLWSPTNDDRVLIEVRNSGASTSGIAELNVKTGAMTMRFERFEHSTGALVSPKTRNLLWVSSHQQSPGDLWLWNLADAEPRRLGGLNAFLTNFALGQAERLTWRTADGRDLAGALLLPADYQPGTRVPLFVDIYGGDMGSQFLNKFGFASGAGIAAFNDHILASRGYAVLAPDAPLRMGAPLAALVEAVMPGVDAAIAQGYADPDRLAIGGHSYGAYSTLALITQTTRFKAAIISGVQDMNLESEYLRMSNTGVGNDRWAETGQGSMGGTPWQYPDRYRANSPIHAFEKITTPVLIVQGELDAVTPITGANSTFAALRRLGKKVEYRIYEGDGHAFRRAANVIDFWNRRLEFLSEYLDIAVDAQGRVILDHGRARPRR